MSVSTVAHASGEQPVKAPCGFEVTGAVYNGACILAPARADGADIPGDVFVAPARTFGRTAARGLVGAHLRLGCALLSPICTRATARGQREQKKNGKQGSGHHVYAAFNGFQRKYPALGKQSQLPPLHG